MQRRQFLSLLGHSTGLALVGLSLPSCAESNKDMRRLPLFVGLGNGGANYVQGLPAEFNGKRGHMPFLATRINRSDGESAKPLETKEHDRLLKLAVYSHYLDEISRVVLMAGLSRATGGELIARVAQRYQQAGIDVSAVVTLPFDFEGKYWVAPAERQLAELRGCGCRLSVIQNAEVVAGLPANISVLEALRAANRKVIDAAVAAAWRETA